MSQQLSRLNLDQDFREVQECDDAKRWEIARAGDLEVRVRMFPSAAPQQAFMARLLWSEYPDAPPSLKFVDIATGRLDLPNAWPEMRGTRPTSLDACVNYCAEGFVLHPEWRSDPNLMWPSNGNALLRVLRTLQKELDTTFVKRYGA